MKDSSDHIIYIGKARSLKRRVSQYFQRTDHDTKTRALLKHITDLEYIVTPTEIDALILESNLIKEHRPRYNVDLKDDKQYPYIKVTVKEDFPRIFITRRKLMDGARYFGPYTNARAVRETLRLITRIFKLRQCKKKMVSRGRPCLNYHMELCRAPCTGAGDGEEYRAAVDSAIQFLEGKNKKLIRELQSKMEEHVSKNEFEAAAVIRDQLQAIQAISRRQQVTGGSEDWDAVSISVSSHIACAQVLYIRDGNMVGRAGFTLNAPNAQEPEVMGAFLKQYYSEAPIPAEILLDTMPDDPAILQWLKQAPSGRVDVLVPVRGRKKELVDMAARNAQSLLTLTLLKEEKKEKTTHGALVELQDVLGLEGLPRHIEAFDISNIGGSDAVGSMVVFSGGRPDRKNYRLFNIRTIRGVDDPAMMEEVVARRIVRISKGEDQPPDLMVVDGGPAQVGAALRAIQRAKLDIPVIGLAKQLEHIYIPGDHAPLILPDNSPALVLLKHVRDESHRFAISHHRRRRSARLRASVLDGIPGVGKKRKELLIRHFGSLDGVRRANREELEQVRGISRKIASDIFDIMASL